MTDEYEANAQTLDGAEIAVDEFGAKWPGDEADQLRFALMRTGKREAGFHARRSASRTGSPLAAPA